MLIASRRESPHIPSGFSNLLLMPEPKHSGRPGSPLLKLLISREVLAKTGILLILSLLLAAMFPFGTALELEYTVGGVWAQKDLIAPFSFPIYRDPLAY